MNTTTARCLGILVLVFSWIPCSYGEDILDLYQILHRIEPGSPGDLARFRGSNAFLIPPMPPDMGPGTWVEVDRANWFLESKVAEIGSGQTTTEQVARFGANAQGALVAQCRDEWGVVVYSTLRFYRLKGREVREVTHEVFPTFTVSDFRKDRAPLPDIPWAREVLTRPHLSIRLPRHGTVIPVIGVLNPGYNLARMGAFDRSEGERRAVESFLEGADLTTLYLDWFPKEGRFRVVSNHARPLQNR